MTDDNKHINTQKVETEAATPVAEQTVAPTPIKGRFPRLQKLKSKWQKFRKYKYFWPVMAVIGTLIVVAIVLLVAFLNANRTIGTGEYVSYPVANVSAVLADGTILQLDDGRIYKLYPDGTSEALDIIEETIYSFELSHDRERIAFSTTEYHPKESVFDMPVRLYEYELNSQLLRPLVNKSDKFGTEEDPILQSYWYSQGEYRLSRYTLHNFEYSPDDRYIAYSQDKVYVYDLDAVSVTPLTGYEDANPLRSGYVTDFVWSNSSKLFYANLNAHDYVPETQLVYKNQGGTFVKVAIPESVKVNNYYESYQFIGFVGDYPMIKHENREILNVNSYYTVSQQGWIYSYPLGYSVPYSYAVSYPTVRQKEGNTRLRLFGLDTNSTSLIELYSGAALSADLILLGDNLYVTKRNEVEHFRISPTLGLTALPVITLPDPGTGLYIGDLAAIENTNSHFLGKLFKHNEEPSFASFEADIMVDVLGKKYENLSRLLKTRITPFVEYIPSREKFLLVSTDGNGKSDVQLFDLNAGVLEDLQF